MAFGIELELLLKPRSSISTLLSANGWNPRITVQHPDNAAKEINRKALRKTIAYLMTKSKVPASSTDKKYDSWTVTDEDLDEVAGFWRIELVSRTLETNMPWQKEIDTVFDVLREDCEILLTKGCAMHVHVSLSATGAVSFDARQLRNLSKALVYFDDATTRVMPANRKNNEWAMSNVHHPENTPRALRQAFQAVGSTNWGPVFSYFDNQVKMKPHAFMALGSYRYMAWNFSHIGSSCGTVEFRRPPGVKTAADAKYWASFTLAFVREALTTNMDAFRASAHHPGVRELATFLDNGMGKLDRASRGANFTAMREDTARPTVFTAAELRDIKRKKAKKDKEPSVFVEKT
ncbi:hypothetical protein ACHAQA_000835 [Verticillium albo-atrum]